MGHIRLGVLPKSKPWKAVVKMLGSDSDLSEIALITAHAAHEGLELAKKDSGIANVIYLLMKTVMSAKGKNFTQQLKNLGLELSGNESLLDVIGQFDKVLDTRLHNARHRSDLAEMARYSAVDTLTEICRKQTKSLFGNNIQQTQAFFKKYSSAKYFSILGRQFFGKFLYRFLDYHLSRELANHMGEHRRYSTLQECREFKEALEKHCTETALIVKDFSGGWPSVTEFRKGITATNVQQHFIPVALRKIQSELAMR